jgi:Ca-activated chloride channel family protein
MPYTVSPLTLDHDWLLQQMDRLKTGMLEDGTAIGDGLASAVNRLRDSIARSKVVVLLTDGINNRGTLSPDNAAQAAKALGIKVYTVGAGSSGWVPVPGPDLFGGQRVIRQRSDVDEAALQRIARATAALYFRATDLKGLEDVYAQIDQMEKTEISVDQFTLFQERFAPWLLLSMCCMAAEKMLSLTRLGRLP